ncbi:MAG: aspartate kinase [Spartobacteria bacterium AMD-G5]|nr:MAG: aspartate kinase [Spartobacteria bacterium AMD-G5]
MALLVQKYGGTSVGNPERIQNVARRVLATQREGNSVVVVVSAMSGVTDGLIKLAKEVSSAPTDREMDVLLSTGEQTTIALTAMAINSMGGKAVSLTGAQAGIITSGVHTKAKISNIAPRQIRKFLDEGNVCIVAGFQGQTDEGQITTLGRGGSDLTAIAIASALKADMCEIYTDVDGVYTCDPRVVPDARKIDVIAYDELLEMASSGSKVMQSRSVEFAKKFKVPFEVRSSFNNNRGTIVKEESIGLENVVVRGISLERKQAKVTISHVPDKPGTASRIFKALAEANVSIDVIVQNVSVKGTTDISFTLAAEELEKVGPVIERIGAEVAAGEVLKQGGIAKLSVVGIGMRSHSGVAATLFECLGNGGVNIQMISTSEIKIAVILDESQIDHAAKLAHAAFGLAEGK